MSGFINSASLSIVVLLLILGFALLVKGADYFVEGSSSVAKKFHVPSIIIGLTIVAMGTSLPETAVSVTASLTGNNELAISNAVGSNIFNMMVVIGVCALLAAVPVEADTLKRDFPISIICALLLLALGTWGSMTLGRADGILMILLFAGYIAFLIRTAYNAVKSGKVEEEEIKILSMPTAFLCIIGGGAAISFGGDLTVKTASRIAAELGMSQTLIGLTIVSIGTSLPELVTSIVAARKNEVELALGNAIGSNIFNILMVLGIASTTRPILIIQENVIDIIILVVFSSIVWWMAYTKRTISKREGMCMLFLYIVYAVYICMR